MNGEYCYSYCRVQRCLSITFISHLLLLHSIFLLLSPAIITKRACLYQHCTVIHWILPLYLRSSTSPLYYLKTTNMPTIYLQSLLLEDNGSESLSPTAIGLLIGVGFVPVCILAWVVGWLLFAYPSGRNICCCMRKRKRKTDPAPEILQQGSTDTSQETLYEKAAYTMPQQPYAAYSRTESGISSASSGAVSRTGGKLEEEISQWQKSETPASVQGQTSLRTIAVVQEPERFV